MRNDRLGAAALGTPAFLSGGGGLVSHARPTTTASRRCCSASGELDGARLLGTRTLRYMGRNHLPGGAELKAVARPTISETQNDGMGFGLGFSVVLDAGAHEGRLPRGRAGLGRPGQHRVLGRSEGAHHGAVLHPAGAVEHLPAALAAAPARLPGAGGLMHAKLVGVPGSHPVISAELMLRYKGIEFTRLDLPNMSHKADPAAAALPRLDRAGDDDRRHAGLAGR